LSQPASGSERGSKRQSRSDGRFSDAPQQGDGSAREAFVAQGEQNNAKSKAEETWTPCEHGLRVMHTKQANSKQQQPLNQRNRRASETAFTAESYATYNRLVLHCMAVHG
jgi:hypothetical protein